LPQLKLLLLVVPSFGQVKVDLPHDLPQLPHDHWTVTLWPFCLVMLYLPAMVSDAFTVLKSARTNSVNNRKEIISTTPFFRRFHLIVHTPLVLWKFQPFDLGVHMSSTFMPMECARQQSSHWRHKSYKCST
jgi:hypothetical protein